MHKKKQKQKKHTSTTQSQLVKCMRDKVCKDIFQVSIALLKI